MKTNKIALPLLAVLVAFGAMLSATPGNPSTPTNPDRPSTSLKSTNKAGLTLASGLDQFEYWPTPGGYEGSFYVEVIADPLKPTAKTKRETPLNLCIVVDKSGSMAGEKLEQAKQAAQLVVNQLTDADHVSMVIYSSGVEIVGNAANAAERNILSSKIRQISSGGGTNLSGGMETGFDVIKKAYRKNAVNRVLLLSDGLANEGIVDPLTLAHMAKQHNLNDGISLSTFGVGLGFNEVLMNQLADAGSGNYYFIQDAQKMMAIFDQELDGVSNIVARNAEATIQIPKGLKVLKVNGYSFTQEGQTLKIAFRDFSAGETKSVLVRFRMEEEKEVFGFSAKLSFEVGQLPAMEQLAMEQVHELRKALSESKAEESISPEVKSQVVMFKANDNLEDAMRAVDVGNYRYADSIVAINSAYLQSNAGYIPYNPRLESQMNSNSVYGTQLKNAENLSSTDMQILQKSSRASNYDVRMKK